MADATDAALRRSDRVILRKIAGQALLVPVTQTTVDLKEVHILNETALAIWELLAEPRTRGQLVEALGEEYDATAEGIRADIEELLTDFLGRGFICEADRLE